MAELVFYDLPSSKPCATWSLNTWKIRMILNYKAIPYKTEWLEALDIEPKFKKLGIKPHVGYWKNYTVPAVLLPDGTAIMDSMPIAEKLETLYPEPSLHLDTGVPQKIQEVAVDTLAPWLLPIFIPLTPHLLSSNTSREHFEQERARIFGMSMQDFAKEKGGEAGWEAAQPVLKKFAEELNRHKVDEGPFVLGSEVSYADFIAAGMFEWMRKIDAKYYGMFMEIDSSLKRLHEACKPWMERDDH
ncbi:hypothetical protein K431DRAFT_214246 [Polychaeton citri CBS 116435]|uniref:GST N-terminal domain-containing protein n=1 Tax=Polychaeton citri CBS 116435 TaxID=1314669 RepID=A0A9P4QK06_9PEZI|nr:hypothetical protein K431DRAFT_214246 [Polychaeton citri CBS 116435]